MTATVNDIEHIESQIPTTASGVIKVFFHPERQHPDRAWRRSWPIAQTVLRSLSAGRDAAADPELQRLDRADPAARAVEQDAGRARAVRPRPTASCAPSSRRCRVRSCRFRMAARCGRSWWTSTRAALQAKQLSPLRRGQRAQRAEPDPADRHGRRSASFEYDVALNGSPKTIEELNDLPIRTVQGSTIYIRDVAHVRDGFPAADQHRAARRPARRAADDPEVRQRFHARHRRPRARRSCRASRPRCRRSWRCRPRSTSRCSSARRSTAWSTKAILAGCLTALMILLVPGKLAQHADHRACRFRWRSSPRSSRCPRWARRSTS